MTLILIVVSTKPATTLYLMEVILFLRVVKTLIGVFGIVGNGLVCLVIFRVPFMHTVTNAFIFHQAAIDLMASLFLLLHANIPDPDPIPSGLAGSIFCRLWNGHVILWILLVASTFNLVVLTMERYIAIVFPFRYETLFNSRVNAIILIMLWILAIGYKSVDIARYGYENGTCVFLEVSWKKELGLIVFFVEYLIPLLVMIFAYGWIIVILKQSAKRLTTGLSSISTTATSKSKSTTIPSNSLGGSLMKARRNTFKTLLIVFLVFALCWTPNQIVFLIFNFGHPVEYSSAGYITTVCMASANCCVNPVVYAMKYRQFRKGVRKCFGINIAVENGSTSAVDTEINLPQS